MPTIFSIATAADFEQHCLTVFRLQAQHCTVYKTYMNLLGIAVREIKSVREIPFLPITFFKTHEIITGDKAAEMIFTSSGTTGMQPASHFVTDVNRYKNSFTNGFRHFYGSPTDYTLLALLPSYMERQGSSLVYMVENLMMQSGQADNGFYLHNFSDLHNKLQALKQQGKKVLLIGVSYALMDFVEQFPVEFPELIVMETGGMKGKREELPKQALHQILCKGFGVQKIHSEYGMAELLSQAYSKGDGIFHSPPWMRVCIRDQRDPLSLVGYNTVGGVNIIDLANSNSCSFIATQDLGKYYANGSFEITGRFEQSDVRGCNLLYEN